MEIVSFLTALSMRALARYSASIEPGIPLLLIFQNLLLLQNPVVYFQKILYHSSWPLSFPFVSVVTNILDFSMAFFYPILRTLLYTINGILVEVSDETFLPWEIFHYGVTSGAGVYRTEGGNMGPQPDRSLERRTDRDGYLTYEKIEAINADNRNATEVYIGDSLPDTSRLVN